MTAKIFHLLMTYGMAATGRHWDLATPCAWAQWNSSKSLHWSLNLLPRGDCRTANISTLSLQWRSMRTCVMKQMVHLCVPLPRSSAEAMWCKMDHVTVTTFRSQYHDSKQMVLFRWGPASGAPPKDVFLQQCEFCMKMYEVHVEPQYFPFHWGTGICMTNFSHLDLSRDVIRCLVFSKPVRRLFLSNAFARFSATWSNLQGESRFKNFTFLKISKNSILACCRCFHSFKSNSVGAGS